MFIKTKYFGELPFNEEETIEFENGLFGFEDFKRFVLIRFENESGKILCLQNLDDVELNFIVINPFSFISDYEPKPEKEEIDQIGARKCEDLVYYNICVMNPSIEDSTVNLRCPVVINPDNKKGIQVILDNNQYSYKYSFKNFIKED